MNSKFTILSLSLIGLVSSSAQARDSTWLLCRNKAIALNVYEHRNGDVQRAVSLNLLYGAHSFTGDLAESTEFNHPAGTVSLTRTNDPSAYAGNVKIDFSKKTAELNGSLTLDYRGVPGAGQDDVVTLDVNQKMKCKVLDQEI